MTSLSSHNPRRRIAAIYGPLDELVELPPFHGGGYCGFETHTGHHASVAQLVEQRSEEPRVAGSIPAGSTICVGMQEVKANGL